MSTISFELSKKKEDDTHKKQILVRVSVSRGFRVGGKTRIFVSPKDWDDKKHTLRRSSKLEKTEKQREIEDTRKTLNELQEHISRAIIECKDLEKMASKEERQDWINYVIASFYDPCVRLVKEKSLTFEDFAKIYVEVRSKEEHWKPSIIGHFNKKKVWDNPSFDKLSAVQAQVYEMNPRLLMDDITAATLDEYQNFLIRKGFLNSTVENHMFALKRILKWADEKGYLKHGAEVVKHKTAKLEITKPKAINYLTWEEFEKLFSYEFKEGEEHLELTRDRFCFCCATSLRHSDMEILKKADFDDHDNPTCFSFVSKKTHDELTIFLNKYSKALYQKYKDIPTRDGLMFPPKSNQKMNDNLKVIAEMLGFTRVITKMQFCGKERIDVTRRLCDVIGTHSARRTFVVHALEMGWSPQLVMTYTGHEDYDTMKPYIALTDKTRKKMMETNF